MRDRENRGTDRHAGRPTGRGEGADLPRGGMPSKDGPPADPCLCSFNWEPEPNRRLAAGESQRFVSLADHYSSALARARDHSESPLWQQVGKNRIHSRPLPPSRGRRRRGGVGGERGGSEVFLRYCGRVQEGPRSVSILPGRGASLLHHRHPLSFPRALFV
jgi:hypothetical protein